METKRKERDRVLFVRVSEEEHERVMLAADKVGVSASGLIRMVIARAIRDGSWLGAA